MADDLWGAKAQPANRDFALRDVAGTPMTMTLAFESQVTSCASYRYRSRGRAARDVLASQ
jgi:hypothetical protein